MMQSCRSHEFHSTDNLHLQPPFLENPRGTRSTASETSGFSSNKNTLCECAYGSVMNYATLMYGGILRSRSKSLTTRIACLCMNESLPTELDPKYPPGQKWFHQLLTLPYRLHALSWSVCFAVGKKNHSVEVQEWTAPEHRFWFSAR